ncbi:hypothetical protein [Streptomyces ipomoeae]|uniref:hypothetical protein n=1 Tax=Streptomyces ipomoeae TaxID=103232 RepID=UPI0011463B5B|nr:hypothetical protein [Streptomyces ipomoeae]TQE40309.1 hypothetical protein Sipo7851_01250 [Streptomyces ipomoeae]
MSDYCGIEPTAPTTGPAAHAAPHADPATAHTTAADGPPFAACVLCQEPTEYPESYKGITLCPVCEWREAERTACSG